MGRPVAGGQEILSPGDEEEPTPDDPRHQILQEGGGGRGTPPQDGVEDGQSGDAAGH